MDYFLDKSHGKGSFSSGHAPALRIKPGTGETIGFETSDEVYVQLHEHKSMDKLTAQINPVTGPLYVEGAMPGDALAVTIHDIQLRSHGWSVCIPGCGALRHVMGSGGQGDGSGAGLFTRLIPIDGRGVHVTDRHAVPQDPMIGCIGTAPSVGANSTVMPACAQGGNMDVTQCRPGSVVYLPVEVEGAYLFIGDIHAVMAEGESSFIAIEAEGTAVVSVDVVKGMRLRAPRIETADELIFVGLGDPVQESITRGYEDLFHFLVRERGFTPGDAYALMSAVCHSRLGGPTGSQAPDPLHPFMAIGAVTLHHLPKKYL